MTVACPVHCDQLMGWDHRLGPRGGFRCSACGRYRCIRSGPVVLVGNVIHLSAEVELGPLSDEPAPGAAR